MNRARSPLFMLTITLLALVGAGLGMSLEASSGPAPWKIGTGETVQRLGLIFAAIAMIPLAVILLMELAIRLGWEPHWLRIRYIGATILAKEWDEDRPGHGWLTVALPDKRMERFSADADEFNAVAEMQVVRLEVIGQYVADVRRMTGTSAAEAEEAARHPANRQSVRKDASILRPGKGIAGWGFMLFGPLIAGGMASTGLLAIILQSADYRTGRRYHRYETVLTGETAVLYGIVLLILGLGYLGYCYYSWKTGWDPDEFDRGQYWDDYPGRGCRRGWW